MVSMNMEITSNDGQAISGGMFFYIPNKDGKSLKRTTMENITNPSNTVIAEIAEFAYQMYLIFDNKYEATPIKIQKIIFISEMVCAYNENTMLPANVVYECNGCGFRIPSFDKSIKDFISIGELKNEAITPTNEEYIQINQLISDFAQKNILHINHLQIIADAIVRFGRYFPNRIGEILNDFKKDSEDNFFAQEPPFRFFAKDFKKLLKNAEKLVDENEIATFIVNYETRF